MFPLYDKTKGVIHIISGSSHIAVREDRDDPALWLHVVRLCSGEGYVVIFSGTQVECELFVEMLFYALRDAKGADVGGLAQRAREGALKESA